MLCWPLASSLKVDIFYSLCETTPGAIRCWVPLEHASKYFSSIIHMTFNRFFRLPKLFNHYWQSTEAPWSAIFHGHFDYWPVSIYSFLEHINGKSKNNQKIIKPLSLRFSFEGVTVQYLTVNSPDQFLSFPVKWWTLERLYSPLSTPLGVISRYV